MSGSFGKAKNCILLYLSVRCRSSIPSIPSRTPPKTFAASSAPSKPSLPGVRFSELLPLSAKWMHKIGLVRTMCHDHNDHGRGSYWMFTGYPYLGSVTDVNSMSRADMPHMGSCVAKLAPGKGPMFPFALVPHRMDVAGGRRAGQFAGSLGGKYDPLLTGGNPNDDNFKLDHLPLAPNEVARRAAAASGSARSTQRADQRANDWPSVSRSARTRRKALDVISSERCARRSIWPAAEPEERARYGRNLFGQSVLLGKRLLDAGARLVQCNWQRTQGKNGFAWDTHWNNFAPTRKTSFRPSTRRSTP